MPHRTAGCGKSSLRPLMAGSSPSLPDGSNPSAAIVQSASDVQCSRLLKTTQLPFRVLVKGADPDVADALTLQDASQYESVRKKSMTFRRMRQEIQIKTLF